MGQKMLNLAHRLVIGMIVMLLFVGMSTIVGYAAGGNVIFEDNFDSYATGSFPSSGGWSLKYNGIGTSHQIVDNSQSTSSPNSLKLEGQANWAATADHSLSMIADQVVYEGDIKVTQPGSTVMNYQDAEITLANPNVNTWGTHYASVKFGREENRVIYLTGTSETMPYNFNQWYHVKASVDNINKQYSVWIDGTFLGSGTFGSTGDYTVIRLIGGNNAHTRVWFDEVKVYQEGADTTPPTLSIISPADGTTFDTSSVLIDGTASDNIGLSKVEVKVGTGSWQLASGTTSWSRQVSLSSGANAIYIKATDTSGKTTEKSITLIYNPPDTISPSIFVTSPSNGNSFDTDAITIRGTASDNVGLSKVEVKIGSGSWQLASGTTSWSKSATFSSGSNTIYARATDTSGNTRETSVTISYTPPPLDDTTLPSISISPHSSGKSFDTDTITVQGTASDDSGLSKVEVKIGSGNWQLASGTTSWSKSITLNSGSNTIYARATDTSGNTKETSVIIRYTPPPLNDTTSPSISISSPSSGKSFDTDTITVQGTASDDSGLSKIEVKVGSGSWQLASGTTSWSKSITLNSGSNTIYARATDTSGNTKETSVIIRYTPPPLNDTTSPSISISSPSSGKSFDTDTITVSGTASDDSDLSKVEVKIGTGSWQLASGTTSWSKSITLSSGSNTIYARATDVSGNIEKYSVTINYIPQDPASTTTTPSASEDSDGDDWSEEQEYAADSDPHKADTDLVEALVYLPAEYLYGGATALVFLLMMALIRLKPKKHVERVSAPASRSEPKKPLAQSQEGTASTSGKVIDIKTAFGYKGATIQYKVNVKNPTSEPIADVKINLYVPDVFLASESTKSIAMLKPSESKTVTFEIRPTGECGECEISGKVVYYDYSTKKTSGIDIPPKNLSIVCPILRMKKISEPEWHSIVSNLIETEESTREIEMPAEALFTMTSRIVKDMHMHRLEPEITNNQQLFNGVARFYGEGVKGLKYAAQVEVIGGVKKSRLILKTWAEKEEALTGFYHGLLDEIEKRVPVKGYIDDSIVQNFYHYGDKIGTQVNDSIVQRSNIGAGGDVDGDVDTGAGGDVAEKKCPTCGTVAEGNGKYCNECGAKL